MNPPALELPTLTTPPATAPLQSVLEPAERDQLIRRAKALSWLSLAYMSAEGTIAITAATLAPSRCSASALTPQSRRSRR